MFILFIFLVLFMLANCNKYHSPKNNIKFQVVYEWETIDFKYEDRSVRKAAKINGDFIPKNVLISDIKAYSDRLYLTMPRLLNGVPATLGWIPTPKKIHETNTHVANPSITPFPSWEYNKEGDCRAMQCVQGITIDDSGLMWVVDSGISQILLKDHSTVCVPKLLIIDLKNNCTVIHIYEFPEDVVAYGQNYLSNIVVDDAYGGFAYITDSSVTDPGIVVFFRKYNHSWKVREKKSMEAAKDAVNFNISGTNLRFIIHINSIAIGPYIKSKETNKIIFERNIYYSPLSSYHLYSIPASILRDSHIAKMSNPEEIFTFVTDYGLKSSQSDGMIMDKQGNLYYSLLQTHEIAKWNSSYPFTHDNQKIIARDKHFIQWVDGMSFDENCALYVVVNRLLNFMSGPITPNKVNFRILKADLKQSRIRNKSPTRLISYMDENPTASGLSTSQIIFSNWQIIYDIIIVLKVYMFNLYL